MNNILKSYNKIIINCNNMIEKIEDLKCCVQKDIINYNKLRNNKNKSIKQIKAKKQVRMIIRNDRQKEWYYWRKRAQNVGVEILKNNRPTKKERESWKNKIILNENKMGICDLNDKKINLKEYRKMIKRKIRGHIYLIQDTTNKFVKIGYTTTTTKARMKSLQTSTPNKLKKIIDYEGFLTDEKRVHKMFEKKRIRNEWFNLDETDIIKINNYFNKKGDTNV